MITKFSRMGRVTEIWGSARAWSSANIFFVHIGPRIAEKIPENIINFASYLEKSYVNSSH